jgi:membrane protein
VVPSGIGETAVTELQHGDQVNLKVMWKLLKATFFKWSDDHAQGLGAALAFYTVFSLAPLLLIAIAIAGLVFGQEAAEGQILGQIRDLVGDDSAKTIQDILENVRKPSTGVIATCIAGVTLFFGATGVFAQVQEALNTIWGVETNQELGIVQILKSRFLSFLTVLGSGFLLLVSLILSAGLAAIGHRLEFVLHGSELLIQLMNFLISFGTITLLFAMIYKILPDVSIQWSDVWIGAGMTSLLFTIGKLLIGLYLGKTEVGLVYGAAGSLIVILLWVYYASQIFLFGAEFTAVYARSHGSRIETGPDTMPIAIHPSARATGGRRASGMR